MGKRSRRLDAAHPYSSFAAAARKISLGSLFRPSFPIPFTTTLHPPSLNNNFRQSRVNMFLSARFAHLTVSSPRLLRA